MRNLSLNNDLSLAEQLASQNLFREKNIFLLRSDQGLNAKEINWLKHNMSRLNLSLIIYKEGTLPAVAVSKLKALGKIEKYDLPKTIFKFLESFYPGNAVGCLKLLQEVKKSEPPLFILSLLARQLKLLYLCLENSDGLDLPAWRMMKLKRQAEEFSLAEIKSFICLLADLNVKSKTGNIALEDSLDLLILQKLK